MKSKLTASLFALILIYIAGTDSVQAEPRRARPKRVAWATPAHNYLMQNAFTSTERQSCINEMIKGSLKVDELWNQLSSGSYQHAMRADGESVDEALAKMWKFVANQYATAIKLKDTPELYCYARGMALHPIMDSTSPAHAGFQVWKPLHVVENVLRHGDFADTLKKRIARVSTKLANKIPDSEEGLEELSRSHQAIFDTVALMQIVDEMYLKGDAVF